VPGRRGGCFSATHRRERLTGRFVHPLVRKLLRSRLHDLLSARVALVCVRRPRSGRSLSTPVNYLHQGDSLTIVSLARSTWWRNLRGSAPVTAVLEGRERNGWGEAVETTPAELAGQIRRLYE
jgi:hypothetical protein